MNRIDPHVSQPPLARPADKNPPHRDVGPDFLEHLHTGQPDIKDPGAQVPTALPSPDGNQLPQAELPSIAPGPRQQVVEHFGRPLPVGEIVVAATCAPQAEDMLPTVEPMPVTLAQVATRTRVFEQHWFANGYLSYLGASTQGEGWQKNDRAAASPTIPLAPPPEPECATPSASTSPSDESPGAVAWPVMVDGPGAVSDTTPRAIERMARALGPLVAADRPWPERLLRLSHRPDGKIALWVRDYGLSSGAIDPLVAHLRQLARGNGIALDRVVVNGTVIWHSESFEGEA